VFFPLAAFEGVAENSRLGFARKNVAPHQGSAWSNSASALGIDGALVETRIGSRYTGKERDSESGLDNFGARYDSSSLGRFLSPDSTAYVKPINPQNWNLYSYALDNPLLYNDPTGHTVSVANCANQDQCAQLLGQAAILPKGVTATVDKNGNVVLNGDLSKITGGNALRLLQLINSDKTASFWIGDKAPGPGGTTINIKGGLSGTPSEEYPTSFSVVQADPSTVKTPDLSGVFLNTNGSRTNGEIPTTNQIETAAHELLGHVWAELVDGQPALVNHQVNNANLKEALIAEDRVRNTDPARGLKIRHQDSSQLVEESDLPRITNPGSAP
jgi:RHS repeat-associated protein